MEVIMLNIKEYLVTQSNEITTNQEAQMAIHSIISTAQTVADNSIDNNANKILALEIKHLAEQLMELQP
jgi:hypothetical protein